LAPAYPDGLGLLCAVNFPADLYAPRALPVALGLLCT